LYQLARLARPTPGAMAEVGVFRGGTTRLIADTVPEKPFHLFDTFDGMPETAPTIDRHDKGDFAATSFESVREFLRDHPHIVFHRGLFPTTTAGLEHERFSFVHVDVDIYASVRSALEFFYPRVSPGGVLVFDDYEWKDCPGVKQALDEFLRDKPERPLITTRFQCALLRR
jgi:O-methyltransferase